LPFCLKQGPFASNRRVLLDKGIRVFVFIY
jgi:hypothetical protein